MAGSPARRSALRDAQLGELVDELVEAVLERLEAPGERAQALLEPLDVGARGHVQGPHRVALGGHRALAGAQRLGQRAVENGVLDQRLGELAHGLLAAGADAASIVGSSSWRR